MKMKTFRRVVSGVIINLFFIACCFLALLPILYALSVSLDAKGSLLSSDFSFIPKEFTLAHYIKVFTEEPVLLWFRNTMLLTAATVALAMATAVPAAYVFSRKRFAGRSVVLRILLLLYSFPSILSMFAIYKLMSAFGLVNTHIGLIIIYAGTMSVFALLNMKGYFDAIPVEIEEAGRIDGCSDLNIVTKIVLPLARPTLNVTGVMIVNFVWNEYIFSINFLTGSDRMTLASGLYSLQATETSGSWPMFAAASLVVSFPILVIFFLSQKHMISGLTSGGVKG
ncbi:MAG: sugar ABC transporter permease [Christensenellales bacterium]|jgi:arabinogalactan oligomer/maltooligosaccharide transport system permease protein|nr:carbohydrate ABC transporter permease [Clostridiales bacterium]